MGLELKRLHHVGHVVRDMAQGRALYRRLGFSCPPPAFPVISIAAGDPPRALGAGNTHATFADGFVELMTVVSEHEALPPYAETVPLAVPPAAVAQVLETVTRTVERIAQSLARFEGLHILVFHTLDAEASARAFDLVDVRHSGVTAVQRPIAGQDGRFESVRHLEIDGDVLPEGRLAVAEAPHSEVLHAQGHMDHPNGAIELVESVLCVADAELDSFVARYRAYLGRGCRIEGGKRVFGLDGGAGLTIVAASALDQLLPGERPPALSAFVAYGVAVRDLAATRALLQANGLPVREAPRGHIFVPADAALGAAVIFRAPL